MVRAMTRSGSDLPGLSLGREVPGQPGSRSYLTPYPSDYQVDLTCHWKNPLILVEGPEIVVRPVAARPPARGDAR